ncbi:MAG: 1,4-dihydroxy-2-naphthoate octaprenyltransferase [Akkermansia sp.]|nr:1,4-dihydroxy-2-naphthoate octaprenyltransferase [Akkermansia sp.]
MNKLRSIILAARPKTLPAGFVAVWAGCLIVWKFQQHFPQTGIRLDWWLAAFTALSCACIQIACNFFNDAIDATKNADTDQRQGPRRITASGDMSPTAVKLWGCFFLVAAAAFGVPLILAQGWPVLLIGIPSLFFAYGYTGGPWPLAYHGLGELFVLLFFGLVAVVGTVFVQIGWQPGFLEVYCCAIVLGVQCGLLSCLLIEVNNIRDRKEDATTGKRTLAVRWGEKRARGLAMAFLVAPYVTLKQTAFFLPGFNWNLVWLAAIILGGFILLKLNTMPANKKMNMLLGLSSLHMGLFLLALTL